MKAVIVLFFVFGCSASAVELHSTARGIMSDWLSSDPQSVIGNVSIALRSDCGEECLEAFGTRFASCASGSSLFNRLWFKLWTSIVQNATLLRGNDSTSQPGQSDKLVRSIFTELAERAQAEVGHSFVSGAQFLASVFVV